MRIISGYENFDFPLLWVVSCLIVVLRSGAAAAAIRAVLYCTVLSAAAASRAGCPSADPPSCSPAS